MAASYPTADFVAEVLVEGHQLTQCWHALYLNIGAAVKRYSMNECEIALRVMWKLGWPDLDGWYALEIAATATLGGDEMWDRVMGSRRSQSF